MHKLSDGDELEGQKSYILRQVEVSRRVLKIWKKVQILSNSFQNGLTYKNVCLFQLIFLPIISINYSGKMKPFLDEDIIINTELK